MSTLQKSVGEVLSSEGQVVQTVPVVFEAVVYCNVCNVDGDKEDRGILKGALVEEALTKGWKDMDWGPTCPECQKELDSMDEGVLSSGAIAELGPDRQGSFSSLIKHFRGF